MGSLLSLLAITLPVTPSCSKVYVFPFALPFVDWWINLLLLRLRVKITFIVYLFISSFLFQIFHCPCRRSLCFISFPYLLWHNLQSPSDPVLHFDSLYVIGLNRVAVRAAAILRLFSMTWKNKARVVRIRFIDSVLNSFIKLLDILNAVKSNLLQRMHRVLHLSNPCTQFRSSGPSPLICSWLDFVETCIFFPDCRHWYGPCNLWETRFSFGLWHHIHYIWASCCTD